MIKYLLIWLITLYVGILNRRSWPITLFFAEIILFFFEAAAVFYQKTHLISKIELPETAVNEQEPVRAKISFKNIGYIPIQRIKIQAEYRHISIGKKKKNRKKITLWGTVDSYDTQSYQILANSLPCGRFLFSIPYIRIYDYFGIFSLKVNIGKSNIITVLPSFVDMPVLLTNSYTLSETELDETKKGQDATGIYDIREYQPGDNLRQIYWKRSANRQEFLYREPAAQKGIKAVLFWKIPEDFNELLFQYQLKIAGSCSYSFLREGFLHFLVWENPIDKILERRLIETEQDIYETIIELLENISILSVKKKKKKKIKKKDAQEKNLWEEEIKYQYLTQFSSETCPEAFFLSHSLSSSRYTIILKRETEIIGEFLKETHFLGGKEEEKKLEKEIQEMT